MNQLDKLVRWVLGIVLVLLALTFARGCDADRRVVEYERKMTEWKHTSEVMTENSIALDKRLGQANKDIDSLIHSASIKSDSIAHIRTIQRYERVKNDSALASLETKLPAECSDALKLAKSYRKEADDLNVALDVSKSETVDREKARKILADGLESMTSDRDKWKKQALTVPEYKPQKFLGMNLPSRKQSFIAGTLVGVTVAAVTYTAVHNAMK
jgi:hypothetical protein